MNKSVQVGVASAGLLLFGATPASANGGNWTTAGNTGVANGIQVSVPVQAPFNFCGNAIGLLGSATASCVGGATASFASGGHGGKGGGWNSGDWSTTNNIGIANGDQVGAMFQVPVNICGNAIGILGDAVASCKSGATASAFSSGDHHHKHHPMPPYGHDTHKKLVDEDRLPRPVATPKVTTVAKAKKAPELGVIGELLTPVTELLGVTEGYGHSRTAGKCGGPGGRTSSGNIGIANGIQAYGVAQLPFNFSGNGIGVLGTATGSANGGATAKFC